MPEAWDGRAAMPQTHSDLFAYCNSVMEPWDGPAAICRYRRPLGGRRHGPQRPAADALLASPTTGCWSSAPRPAWCRWPRTDIVAKGRVGPGQMIARRPRRRAVLPTTRELKDTLAEQRRYGDWVENITVIDDLLKTTRGEPARFESDELRRRQVAAGLTHGGPGADPPADGGGRQGSRRLDGRRHAAGGALSDQYRGLHHFFRQNFSQVTNPPIDSLREQRVMSLKTRLGNLGNVLDEDESQCRLLQLEVAGADRRPSSQAMRAYMGAERGGDRLHLRPARRRSRAARRDPDASAARPRTRCAAAPPTDPDATSAPGRTARAIPMILATGAVHSASACASSCAPSPRSTCARASAWTCITSPC